MQLRRKLFFAWLIPTLSARAYSQTLPPTNATPGVLPAPQGVNETHQTRVLSMEEAIQLGLRHNLDIQISRYNPVVDQYTINSAYGAYEPNLGFTAKHSYDSSSGGFRSDGTPFPANTSSVNAFAPSISGVLPTGLNYDLNAGPALTRTTSTLGTESGTAWSSSPGITLQQPILRNFWIDNTRYQIQLDKNQLHQDQLALRLQIMKSITQIKTAYFNLIAARQTVQVNVEALQLANQLVEENRKRVQVGALAPLDEKQSESQAATSRANLIAAEQSLGSAENTLKNLLTENFIDWEFVSPVPSEPLLAIPAELNLQESWRRGVTQRPEMLQAKLAVEKLKLTIKYNYNQLFPSVDLLGTYGHNATDPTFSANLDDVRRGTFPYYSYGVAISIPLGNSGPRNAYRSAKASQEQAVLQLKQTEQGIVVAIDNDVKAIRANLQQITATREARVYAELALDAEQKKLQNGKSTSFVVLQLQSNLTSARSAEISALATYNIALEQLSLDEGTTLERNRIDLEIK